MYEMQCPENVLSYHIGLAFAITPRVTCKVCKAVVDRPRQILWSKMLPLVEQFECIPRYQIPVESL